MMCRIAAMILLLGLSGCDLKSRTIPAWPVVLFAGVMLPVHFVLRDLSAIQILTGGIPGLLVLLLSAVRPSSIGIGDGMAIAACGLAVGFSEEFTSLVTSLFLCGIWSALLLVLKKAEGKDSIPFLPFLTAGHIAAFIAERTS